MSSKQHLCYVYKNFIFSKDVNFEELARCTDDFNGAQCKAVCVEAVNVALFLKVNFDFRV
jgi:ATP-dependent 26S proteasome regulatory subunit